jgi:hypothetical protein
VAAAAREGLGIGFPFAWLFERERRLAIDFFLVSVESSGPPLSSKGSSAWLSMRTPSVLELEEGTVESRLLVDEESFALRA